MAVLITLFSMGNVSASAAAKVAALMYHSVTTDSSRWNDYTISPEQLDAIYNTLKLRIYTDDYDRTRNGEYG